MLTPPPLTMSAVSVARQCRLSFQPSQEGRKQVELEGHSESADLRQAAHIDTKMSTQATRSYNQD